MLQFSNFRRQARNIFKGVGEKIRGPKSLRNFGVESLELRDCPAISFLNFVENSPTDPTPLLGTNPTIITNSALFDPNGFQSAANPVSPSDSTVDFLTFTINATQGTTISKLNFTMSGDTTITGIPTSFAAAGVSANAFIRVTQLDGTTATNVTKSINLVFNPNSGQFSLANDGSLIGKIINGNAEIDVDALLSSNSISGKATSIDVTLTTTLNTNASSNGSAFIQLKQAAVDVTTLEPTGSIGDTVWIDYNGNGVQDPGDNGLDGVPVNLLYAGADNTFGTADDQTFTTTTANGGKYLFDNLTLGAYLVSVNTASPTLTNYKNTFDPDGNLDSKSFVTLTQAVPDNLDQDFGYAPATGQIGDTIFNDTNANGVQDSGELGIQGVTVSIKNALTNVTQTTTTDANGNYIFNNLAAGNYTVTVTTGAGTPLAGLTQTADPDGTMDSTSTVALVAPNSMVNLAQDFGYVFKSGSIGDTIFLDTNGNGVQDNGEPGIDGVTVTLRTSGNDGIIGNSDDQTITQVTANGGQYLFSNLLLGDYQVQVDTASAPIVGLTNTADPDGVFDSFSDVTLTSAVPNNLLQDFGYVFKSGTIGDTIYSDLNGNGTQDSGEPGIDGVTVNLVFAGVDGVFGNGDDQTFTTTTANGGKYLFNSLLAGKYQVAVDTNSSPLTGFTNTGDPDGGFDSKSLVTLTQAAPNNLNQDFGYALSTGQIGDTVYNDANGNGVQDNGEVGIQGVTVTLKSNLTSVTQTATTDASGKYIFNNLAAGTYTVTVTTGTGTPLNGMINTGDPDGSFDSKSTVSLVAPNSMINLNQDFGYQSATANSNAILSGVVYVDANNNGIVDNGEIGIGGVTVTLLRSNGTAYVTVATTTTDASGFYTFQSLNSGLYKVVETQPANYLDGKETLGTLGGNISNDIFFGINVGVNQIGVGYNFGELGMATVTKRMFLASTGTLTSGTSVASGLAALFGNSPSNSSLVNAFLNPTVARAQGFDASAFDQALELAGATMLLQRSRTSTGTGTNTSGTVDADQQFLDLESNEAIVDHALADLEAELV